MLTARHALYPLVVRVRADERPPALQAGASVYAVFTPDDDPAGAGHFLGLVTPSQIASYHGRIFADLLPRPVPAPVAAQTPLNDVVAHLDREKAEAVAVLEEGGAFLGAVTRASLLDALLQSEPAPGVAAAPIEGLHAASLRLLSLLALHEEEQDLLQPAVETLTALLKARYGAVGIVDEHGRLLRFVHTGITPELAARIGHLPAGRGLLGVVIAENHALRIDDMCQDPRSVGFPPHHPPMKSLLAVPISRDSQVYGRMYFSDRLDGAPFSAEDEHLAAQAADVLGLTLSHHRLQSERRQAANTLHDIAQMLSANAGESLFHKLVLSLATALGVDYAFVGKVSPHHAEIIQTIAFCDHGNIVDDIEYPLVPATVCGSVEGKAECYFPEGVRQLYPEDEILREFHAEAFIGHPLIGASGQVLGLLAIMHAKPLANPGQIQSILQISAQRAVAELERQHAEKALRESEARFRATFNQAAVGIAHLAPDGRWLQVNQKLCEITGYTESELLQRTFQDITHPDDLDIDLESVRQVLAGEIQTYSMEKRYFRKDCSIVWIYLTVSLVRDEQGVPKYFISVIEDISERKRAEMQIRQLASAVEQTADSVIITDSVGVIEYVNLAFEQTTGYSRDNALGRKPNLVNSGQHDQGFYQRLWATIKRGEPFREVFINRRKNGTVYYEEKTITPLKDDKGHITHFVSTGKDITERKQAEQENRQVQHFLNAVVENLPNVLFVKDAKDLRYVRFNKAAEELLGYPRAEMLGKNDYDFFPKVEADFFTTMDREVLNTGELMDIPLESVQTRHLGERWMHTRKIPILDESGQPQYLLGIAEDITERRQTEDRAARLGRILERSSNEIYVFDAATLKFTQANQGALKNLGYTRDELLSLTAVDLKPAFTPEQFRELIEPLRRGDEETLSFETEHKRKDGSLYPVEVRLQFSSAETPPVFVAVISDITERKQAQERLNYLAFYDTLTGLPNRLLLLDRIRQATLESERHARLVAILFLDLDRFKLVNDTLGHDAGDLLLKGVAGRLSGCVRPGDTVARLGGDEFAVVLVNVAHVDDVGRVAQKILNVFAQPFLLAGQEFFASPSMGITLYPLDDTDPEALLKNADAAMYHAKDSGRNNFQFFTPELNTRAARRLDLETALRHALERQEFVLHYQPQVDLTSGRIIGMEALIRWQRPGTGLVSPLDFIPLAEETGLIVPIGEWVLRTACAQNRAWQEAGLPTLHMSVNVAARQFQQQNLAEVVVRVLQETGLDARWLTLEITESTVMHDAGAAIETLRQIGALGVGLSVDDFGTGYSSLSYLKRFPLNFLKIDKSFINDITTDQNDAAIATAIISMAGSLEIQVVAEGVETQAQLDFLRARGCDAMQGYYFSKPLPAAAFASLLAEGTRLEMGPAAAPARAVKKTGARSKHPTLKRKAPAKK